MAGSFAHMLFVRRLASVMFRPCALSGSDRGPLASGWEIPLTAADGRLEFCIKRPALFRKLKPQGAERAA